MSDQEQPVQRVPQTFREFHDEMRKYRRRVFVRVDDDGKKIHGTYRRPAVEGRLKGKLAQKAAKRERVRQMKLAQAAAPA